MAASPSLLLASALSIHLCFDCNRALMTVCACMNITRNSISSVACYVLQMHMGFPVSLMLLCMPSFSLHAPFILCKKWLVRNVNSLQADAGS